MMMHKGCFYSADLPEPKPANGQILTRPLACGVCGSDLHAREHTDHICNLLHQTGFRGFMDPAKPVVLGHEFCCEILDASRSERPFEKGQRVVSLPFLTGPEGLVLIGYSNTYNGAFADQMLLQSDMTFAVPDHVPTEIACLTEPLSVAVHAVAQSYPDKDAAFTVIGCGPVGLLIIARLKALGLGPVLAIEPNPNRRALAQKIGADAVMNPGDGAEDWWNGLGLPLGLSDSAAVSPEARKRQRAIIFECVGKPGMLMSAARGAPVGATIVGVGTCMETDSIEPAFLLQKGLRLQFVFAYSPPEFADAFDMICKEPERLRPLVTRSVGLAEIDEAFKALSAGGADIKILVRPDA